MPTVYVHWYPRFFLLFLSFFTSRPNTARRGRALFLTRWATTGIRPVYNRWPDASIVEQTKRRGGFGREEACSSVGMAYDTMFNCRREKCCSRLWTNSGGGFLFFFSKKVETFIDRTSRIVEYQLRGTNSIRRGSIASKGEESRNNWTRGNKKRRGVLVERIIIKKRSFCSQVCQLTVQSAYKILYNVYL